MTDIQTLLSIVGALAPIGFIIMMFTAKAEQKQRNAEIERSWEARKQEGDE